MTTTNKRQDGGRNMDISSLSDATSAYFDQLSTTTSSLETSLNSGYTEATDEELMDACKEFEAYFLEQMFKEMMNTIPESEDEDSSMSQLTDYMEESWIQEMAATSTDTNSLGLAQMLYEQMKRNYDI